MTPQDLRQELARAIYANARVDYECPRVDDLLPIVWRFAADELRAVADVMDQRVETFQHDSEWGAALVALRLANDLRDRAGVMDGGERR